MSRPGLTPVTAVAYLHCDKCHRRWESTVQSVSPGAWQAEVDMCTPAFAKGWRVFIGARSNRTYCPFCSPTVPMRQLYPAVAS